MARLFAALGALAGLASAGSAFAQSAKPDWAAVPTPADMCRAYPEKAREQGIEGGAALICDVSSDDGLENCSVQNERPAGLGFGEAAKSVAKLHALQPSSWPIGVPIRLLIRFKLPCAPEAGR